jgi:hypothetical protein
MPNKALDKESSRKKLGIGKISTCGLQIHCNATLAGDILPYQLTGWPFV